MENILYDVWLNELKGIGPIITKNLLEHFGEALNIYHALPSELLKVPKVGKKLSQFICSSKDLTCAQKIISFCNEQTIHIISPTNSLYPQRLIGYPLAPYLLYVKGNLAPLGTLPSSAIVGARRCSEYGKRATLELTHDLVSQNTAIISGMAKGIDSYAHTEALNHNGYTIAVVGTGLDQCYPSEHLSLMQKIAEKGALISQFAPFSTTYEQNFLRRNELIAMLSDSIYVLEASKKSGSLYTAECGFKYHKTIYSLPGNIYDSLSQGSNDLIRQGASIYLGTTQNPNPTTSSSPNLSTTSQSILNTLAHCPLSLDELHTQCSLDIDSLHEALFELEMCDQVIQINGLYKIK